MGSLPQRAVGRARVLPFSLLEGHTLNGMAFTLTDGRATWDHAGKSSVPPAPTPTPTPTPSGDTIWVEDSTPSGATLAGDEAWNWISSNPTPFSGTLANQSNLASGQHQQISRATATLAVQTGDTLIAYVYRIR